MSPLLQKFRVALVVDSCDFLLLFRITSFVLEVFTNYLFLICLIATLKTLITKHGLITVLT